MMRAWVYVDAPDGKSVVRVEVVPREEYDRTIAVLRSQIADLQQKLGASTIDSATC